MKKGEKGIFLYPTFSRLSTTPLVDISISPQPYSALRIHDSDLENPLIATIHFAKKYRSPKIRLHCRLEGCANWHVVFKNFPIKAAGNREYGCIRSFL